MEAELSCPHVMPVMHDRAAEVTKNKPEDSQKNSLECWIHAGKNTAEDVEMSVKLEHLLLDRTAPHRSE